MAGHRHFRGGAHRLRRRLTMKQAQRQAYNRVRNIMIPTCTTATTSASGGMRTATGCTPGVTCAKCSPRSLRTSSFAFAFRLKML